MAETGKAADTVIVTVIMIGTITGTNGRETVETDIRSVFHAVLWCLLR